MTHPSTSPLIRRIDREERRARAARWVIALVSGLLAAALLGALVAL